MKINLFYLAIGAVAIVGGFFFYRSYFPPSSASSASALTASVGIASGVTEATSSAPAPSMTESAAVIPVSKNVPTAPTGLVAMASTNAMVLLSWGASYDVAGVAGYKIFMNGKEIGVAAAQKFEAQGLQASTTYSFAVSAYDKNGTVSALSPSIQVTTAPPAAVLPASSAATSTSSSSIDTARPSVPVGLSAIAVSSSEIDLTWTPSTDNVGVAGYRVYSNGVFIATTSGAFYKSTNLNAGSGYSFAIAAYDAAGNVSAQSASTNATTDVDTSTQQQADTSTADTTPPTTDITSPSANATESGTITVSAMASDDVGVVKVELYVDSVLQTSDTSLPYVFVLNTTALFAGSHSLLTKAYDAAGNIGVSPAVAITVSNTAPAAATTTVATSTTGTTSAPPSTAPTHLIATAISATEVDLSWTAPASSTSVSGYRIFRDGHPFALTTGAGTTYNDNSQVVTGTTYSYTVAAYNSTPTNMGPQSASASATTP